MMRVALGSAGDNERRARDAEIVRRYVEDKDTLQDIGNAYGLTRERVRQILRARRVPCDGVHEGVAGMLRRVGAEAREQRKVEARRKREQKRQAKLDVIATMRARGARWQEIGAALGLSYCGLATWALQHHPELRTNCAWRRSA